MPSPFPGMDPYLEEPALWPGVHMRIAVTLADILVPLLRPRYYVTAELRVYDVPVGEAQLIGIGDVSIGRERSAVDGTNSRHSANRRDGAPAASSLGPNVLTVELPCMVEVRERSLEIRRPGTHELITVVEILSPTNKRPGKGRQLYEQNRLEFTSSATNLVEIDLIRAGEPMPVLAQGRPLDRAQMGDYRVVVSRGYRRHRANRYPIRLRNPLPSIPIPLRYDDEEPVVDLQEILHTVYDRGGYDLLVDYRAEPVPPLDPDDATWADALLRERGLR